MADWIAASGVGLLRPGQRDFEAERVKRNNGWRREPLSEVRLLGWRTGVGLEWFSHWIPFLLCLLVLL
jgi:hypothetical protein